MCMCCETCAYLIGIATEGHRRGSLSCQARRVARKICHVGSTASSEISCDKNENGTFTNFISQCLLCCHHHHPSCTCGICIICGFNATVSRQSVLLTAAVYTLPADKAVGLVCGCAVILQVVWAVAVARRATLAATTASSPVKTPHSDSEFSDTGWTGDVGESAVSSGIGLV